MGRGGQLRACEVLGEEAHGPAPTPEMISGVGVLQRGSGGADIRQELFDTGAQMFGLL